MNSGVYKKELPILYCNLSVSDIFNGQLPPASLAPPPLPPMNPSRRNQLEPTHEEWYHGPMSRRQVGTALHVYQSIV